MTRLDSRGLAAAPLSHRDRSEAVAPVAAGAPTAGVSLHRSIPGAGPDVCGPDCDHDHGNHGHDHDNGPLPTAVGRPLLDEQARRGRRDRAREAADRGAPVVRIAPSLLRLGLASRLAIAAAFSVLIWTMVLVVLP